MNRLPDPIPPSKAAVALPMRRDRMVCVFCRKPLVTPDGSSFDDLFIASEKGVLVVSCKEHGPWAKCAASELSSGGDKMLKAIQEEQEKAKPQDGVGGGE